MSDHCVITEKDIRDVLRKEQGWFTPNMESKELILDNYLLEYPYIVVRVFTSVLIETGKSPEDWLKMPKVMAVNLKHRCGWIKTRQIQRLTGWRNDLLTQSRDVWRIAYDRARKQRMPRMTLAKWEKLHGKYPK